MIAVSILINKCLYSRNFCKGWNYPKLMVLNDNILRITNSAKCKIVFHIILKVFLNKTDSYLLPSPFNYFCAREMLDDACHYLV